MDDEQIERRGMQAILEKSFSNIQFQQAKNGKMAVELAAEFVPDLILMDIKMPGMNGLEAVEKISNANPKIKFIMVTAYDTFSYMKAAIKLGVKDYVLKPSKASEIKDTVGKVIQLIEEEQRALIWELEQQAERQKALALMETDVVTQLLFDHVHDVHVDMLVEMLELPSTDEMFVMLVLMDEDGDRCYMGIKELIRQTKSGWVGALYGHQLPIIVFRQPEKTYRSQASHLARQILSTVKKESSTNCFIGIGRACTSLEHVRQSYQDALVATIDSRPSLHYSFHSDSLVSDTKVNSQHYLFKDKGFADLIRLGQWEKIRAELLGVLDVYEKKHAPILQSQQLMLEALWGVSRIMNEIGIETGTPLYSIQTTDYRQLRMETLRLLEIMGHAFTKHISLLEADTVQQVKQYIKKHSHEDISLDSLAKKVGLSPIYISKLFKEKQGINYIDFLTECRIEKAKKLMSDTDTSIKEITFEVGYHDPNYFSKVFKKMTGISPKEYRKTLLGQI